MLTITSRYPSSLFISNRPLLNRKGHSYATKWLWNRLMTGPTYNLSLAALSQDSYYCPSMVTFIFLNFSKVKKLFLETEINWILSEENE